MFPCANPFRWPRRLTCLTYIFINLEKLGHEETSLPFTDCLAKARNGGNPMSWIPDLPTSDPFIEQTYIDGWAERGASFRPYVARDKIRRIRSGARLSCSMVPVPARSREPAGKIFASSRAFSLAKKIFRPERTNPIGDSCRKRRNDPEFATLLPFVAFSPPTGRSVANGSNKPPPQLQQHLWYPPTKHHHHHVVFDSERGFEEQ